MWEEGVKLRSICWQGGGWESEGVMAGRGVLEMGAHLNACIHQPMSCWVEMSWTSPHLSHKTTHMLYTCAQFPGPASTGPNAGRRPSTASIPSKPERLCWRRTLQVLSPCLPHLHWDTAAHISSYCFQYHRIKVKQPCGGKERLCEVFTGVAKIPKISLGGSTWTSALPRPEEHLILLQVPPGSCKVVLGHIYRLHQYHHKHHQEPCWGPWIF